MIWAAVLTLGAISFALKAVGPALAGGRHLSPRVLATLGLLPIPMLAALVLVGTFDGGHRLVLDARAPALAVAALLVWRRAPFLLVICAAALTAALARMV